MKPTEMKILVVGDRAWGKGDTLKEALTTMVKNGGKRTQYIAFIVEPESYVDDMGSIIYKLEFPPKEFHRVGVKKKVQK